VTRIELREKVDELHEQCPDLWELSEFLREMDGDVVALEDFKGMLQSWMEGDLRSFKLEKRMTPRSKNKSSTATALQQVFSDTDTQRSGLVQRSALIQQVRPVAQAGPAKLWKMYEFLKGHAKEIIEKDEWEAWVSLFENDKLAIKKEGQVVPQQSRAEVRDKLEAAFDESELLSTSDSPDDLTGFTSKEDLQTKMSEIFPQCPEAHALKEMVEKEIKDHIVERPEYVAVLDAWVKA